MIITAIITGYCLLGGMANTQKVHSHSVACPAYLPFNTKVIINKKAYYCHDRMDLKYRNGNFFDVWYPNCDDALNFGRQKLKVTICKK